MERSRKATSDPFIGLHPAPAAAPAVDHLAYRPAEDQNGAKGVWHQMFEKDAISDQNSNIWCQTPSAFRSGHFGERPERIRILEALGRGQAYLLEVLAARSFLAQGDNTAPTAVPRNPG